MERGEHRRRLERRVEGGGAVDVVGTGTGREGRRAEPTAAGADGQATGAEGGERGLEFGTGIAGCRGKVRAESDQMLMHFRVRLAHGNGAFTGARSVL